MLPAPSLIPELDDIVRRGDPARRADAARRVSELFLQGAASFRSDHVELFDGVLTSLVPHAGPDARADLAERLSVLANAPRTLGWVPSKCTWNRSRMPRSAACRAAQSATSR